MRHFAQLILGLAYITMIGLIVYHFTNPWWSLMLLFTPVLLRTFSDDDDENPDMM